MSQSGNGSNDYGQATDTLEDADDAFDDGDDETPDEFAIEEDPNSSFTDLTQIFIDLKIDDYVPPPPKFTEDGKGEGISVSTEALKAFANYLDDVKESLKQLLPTIEGIEIKAGAFAAAYDLIKRLEEVGEKDAGGVKGVTEKYLYDIIEVLGVMAGDLRQLANKYDTGEELNAADAKDLIKFMEDGLGYLDKLTGGNSTSPVP